MSLYNSITPLLRQTNVYHLAKTVGIAQLSVLGRRGRHLHSTTRGRITPIQVAISSNKVRGFHTTMVSWPGTLADNKVESLAQRNDMSSCARNRPRLTMRAGIGRGEKDHQLGRPQGPLGRVQAASQLVSRLCLQGEGRAVPGREGPLSLVYQLCLPLGTLHTFFFYPSFFTFFLSLFFLLLFFSLLASGRQAARGEKRGGRKKGHEAARRGIMGRG
jgi:hypothetical protein